METHTRPRREEVDDRRGEMRCSTRRDGWPIRAGGSGVNGMDVQPKHERQVARITLAGEARYLAPALTFIREVAISFGVAPPDASGLERAVGAVASNVIEQGFAPGEPGTLDLVVVRAPGRLVVAVEDRGLPFDWTTLEAGGHSGLSAPALTDFADAVRFLNLGTSGNRVEIVKRLPFAPIDAGKDRGDKPAAAAPAPAPMTDAVSVRLMTPDDAVAVARCAYQCYGYTVPDDYLYYPDHMREMLAGGLLEICVGATSGGRIAGCLTRELDHRSAAVGYLGEGMVDPRFRGHRLLEQMLTFFIRRSAEQGLRGLYAEAVTVHPMSQKSNLALGAFETGVQLADEAPTVVFKQIDDGAPAKRTATVLHYFKTSDAPRRTVHPPGHHQAMIGRIYERGGLARDVRAAPGAAAELPAAAQLRVDVFPGWREASLRVTAYGRDLPDLVHARLRQLRIRRIDWIGLDLPLSHPGARELCAPLEALGFFFAGVIPELDDGDVLRLQYLNDVEADLEAVQIASEFGKELFAYVVAAMRASPDAR